MLKTKSVAAQLGVIAIAAIAAFTVALAISLRLAHCFAGSDTGDLPAWVQAIGAILTIVAGFATIFAQRVLKHRDDDVVQATNARAAHLVAIHAMTTLGERLDAVLADASAKHPYRLRGERTAQMIASLREFDIARVPADMLEKFLQLRANCHAINERISDVYEGEGKPGGATRAQRKARLQSAIDIWGENRRLLSEIRKQLVGARQMGLAADPKAFGFE